MTTAALVTGSFVVLGLALFLISRDPQHLMAALAQALPVDNPIALAGFTA